MIDRIISAYRAQIYDWNINQLKKLLREKWKFISIAIVLLLCPLVIYAIGVVKNSSIIVLVAFLVEGILIWILDRYAVKHHAAFLQNRQGHLKETERFLREVIPNVNLFQKEKIEELINRLSERIDQEAPFKNFLKGWGSFAKTIVLPIVAYVAGVYAPNLGEISFNVIASHAVFIIIFLSIVWMVWLGLSSILKSIFFRDYDAAMELWKDLLDLRLLYFLSSSDSKN